eukprot:681016-Rhodomonas_salina.3
MVLILLLDSTSSERGKESILTGRFSTQLSIPFVGAQQKIVRGLGMFGLRFSKPPPKQSHSLRESLRENARGHPEADEASARGKLHWICTRVVCNALPLTSQRMTRQLGMEVAKKDDLSVALRNQVPRTSASLARSAQSAILASCLASPDVDRPLSVLPGPTHTVPGPTRSGAYHVGWLCSMSALLVFRGLRGVGERGSVGELWWGTRLVGGAVQSLKPRTLARTPRSC